MVYIRLYFFLFLPFFFKKSKLIYMLCSVTQLCPTLYDHMDYSPRGSSIHGISQARILEWVAISSSRDFYVAQVIIHVHDM